MWEIQGSGSMIIGFGSEGLKERTVSRSAVNVRDRRLWRRLDTVDKPVLLQVICNSTLAVEASKLDSALKSADEARDTDTRP